MRSLKLILVFLALIGLTYLGVTFVEANREEVVLEIGGARTGPTALGLVVMTSTFLGAIAGAILGGFEILSLLMQNQKLKKKLRRFEQAEILSSPTLSGTSLISSNPLQGSQQEAANEGPKGFSLSENFP